MHLFRKKKRDWKTPLFWSVGVLATLLLLLYVSLPLFFSSDSLKPQIEDALSRQLGQPVRVNGFVSFRLFPRAFVRAKKIQIGDGNDQISIEKMDFHTSLFSLFRSTSLLSDMTLHRTDLSFDSYDHMLALFGGAYQKGLKNISLKGATLRVGKDRFDSVDFTLYEENDIQHYSLKTDYRGAEFGVTGRLHQTTAQPFQGIVRFSGGRRLNVQGHFVPQTRKITGSFDGSVPLDYFGNTILSKLSVLKASGKIETDFSTVALSDVLLSGKDFSFGGHLKHNKVLDVRGQLHEVPSWMIEPVFIERLLKGHPMGKVDIMSVSDRGSVWRTKRSKESLVVELIRLKSLGGEKLSLQGTALFDSDFSFDGSLVFEKNKRKAEGKLFVTSRFVKVYDANFHFDRQLYQGSVNYDRNAKRAEVALKTNRLNLSKTLLPFDFSGRFIADKLYWGNRSIENVRLDSSFAKGHLKFKNLVGHINGEMVVGNGTFNSDGHTFVLRGPEGRFLSSFVPGISNLPLFPEDRIHESSLEIKNDTFTITQKAARESAEVIARVEGDTVHGQLTYHSDTLDPLTNRVPYLKDKIVGDNFMLTGRFKGKQNHFEMPDVTLRLGGNEFYGHLSKMFLGGETAWSISLKGDKLVWSSVFNVASFQPDIRDNTSLPDWDSFLKDRIEFSLSLTNLTGTRLGHSFSIDVNTKSMPQQVAMRFHQEGGDARLHFTHKDGQYKGFAHTENYHLPEAWLDGDSLNIILGHMTLESEFETSGSTVHQLFNNAIASFDLRSTDGSFLGLSPYYAIWNAKDVLSRGQGAVRRAILKGLKQGQAAFEHMSCRGILKKGKALVRYGKFSSEDFDHGTFEGTFYPMKKQVNLKSRFGLKGLSLKPIDVVWFAEDSWMAPKKTVKIKSPYAYDPAYLKRLSKRSRRH